MLCHVVGKHNVTSLCCSTERCVPAWAPILLLSSCPSPWDARLHHQGNSTDCTLHIFCAFLLSLSLLLCLARHEHFSTVLPSRVGNRKGSDFILISLLSRNSPTITCLLGTEILFCSPQTHCRCGDRFRWTYLKCP